MNNIQKVNNINFKKGWIFRDFVIAMILFSGIVSLFVLFIGGMSQEYNRSDLVSESFSNNYDKLDDLTEKVETMRSTTTGGEGLSFSGTFDVAFGATFTVFQLVFSSLALMATLPAQMIVDFTFIDSTVAAVFFIIGITILVVWGLFVWLSSITRSKI